MDLIVWEDLQEIPLICGIQEMNNIVASNPHQQLFCYLLFFQSKEEKLCFLNNVKEF